MRSVTICRGFYGGGNESGVETNGKMKGEFEYGGIGTMLYDDGAGALSLESVLIALLRITGRLLVPRVLCFVFEAYCLLTRFRDPSLFVNNMNEIVGSRWI